MENYILANCTDTGRVRNLNEDSMSTFESPNGRVLVVCDGMGGQNAGDVASQLAVSVIQDILTDNTFASPAEAITRSIMAANQAILRRASQDASLSGMGSTCVMLIIKDGQVHYGSVGDSRIYYVSDGSIRQITKDQSYVQTLVDAGEITQEAAEHHKDKNQITNALGLDGMTPPVVCQMPIIPTPGSVFLLCSDGLSGMINNATILNTVANSAVPLVERANQLVAQANEAGGLDNITVQMVEFPEARGKYNPGYNVASPQPRSSSRRGNTILFSIIACLLLLIAGGAIYWFILRPVQEPEPKKSERKPKTTKVITNQPKTNEPVKETVTTVVKEEKTVKVRKEESKKPVIPGKKSKPDVSKLTGKDKPQPQTEKVEPMKVVDKIADKE